MAIYHNGNKIISLYHKGKKIESVYHNGIKIYSSGLPIGTILWSGSKAFTTNDPFGGNNDFFNSNFLVNKKITLSNAISKCQNGLVVNFSKAACISSGGGHFDTSYSGNIHLPKSFLNGQIYADSGVTTKLIKSNDSTVYFNSTKEGNNSTYIGFKNYYDYLCIDSITAY